MLKLEPIDGRFQDTGNPCREKESFHGVLFSNIDFSNALVPISFFRSDFRQVKIENVTFRKNNFDRADFIDAYVTDSRFTQCHFGTDFLNTYFDAVIFERNLQDTCTVAQCAFNKCVFRHEVFRNSTFRSCRFIDCTFEECIFEMNTADQMVFEKCEFHKIDFSNMTALNFAFANCKYFEFRIDPDYLGTYLFKGTVPENIAFTLRGESVRLGADYLESLQGVMGSYARANRIFEAFNCAVLYNVFARREKSLKPVLKWAIESIADEPLLRRKNSLLRIIEALAFYTDGESISFSDLLFAAKTLGEVDLTVFPLAERLELESRLVFLRELIKENLLALNPQYFGEEGEIYFEVVTDEDEQIKVEAGMNRLFEDIVFPEDSHFRILGRRHGSIIFECTATIVAVAVFARCLRQASSNLIRIVLELRLSTKYIELLGKARTTEQVTKVHNSVKSLITPPSERANSITTELANVVKEIRILGDCATNDRQKS